MDQPLSTQAAPQARQPINYPALCEVALLALIAALLLTKTARGVLSFYIHPRYGPLVVACGIVLLAIAGVRMRAIVGSVREHFGGRQVGYLLLLATVLVGVAVPAAPLGAGTLGERGMSSFGEAAARWRAQPRNDDTTTWNLLDWATALSVENANKAGSPVQLEGFVLRPSDAAGTVYVARYVVSCCAADASGVGLPLVWSQNDTLAKDNWVRVEGTLGSTTIDGKSTPAIIATTVFPIDPPRQPYLYP